MSTLQSAPVARVKPEGKTLKARISHYVPNLGGVNCSNYQNGQCVAHMASGKDWKKYINKACACPPEFPFGTHFILEDGSKWVCLDRGGKITTDGNGVIWLDLLTNNAKVPYGQIMTVTVIK
jgi:hypothetical protein